MAEVTSVPPPASPVGETSSGAIDCGLSAGLWSVLRFVFCYLFVTSSFTGVDSQEIDHVSFRLVCHFFLDLCNSILLSIHCLAKFLIRGLL